MEEEVAPGSRSQDINPWSVEGGRTEDGKIVSIDYKAIAQYATVLSPTTTCDQKLHTDLD